jgi:hypothetical protein
MYALGIILASIFCFFAGIYGWGEIKDPNEEARKKAIAEYWKKRNSRY